jgi:hypothetical protein
MLGTAVSRIQRFVESEYLPGEETLVVAVRVPTRISGDMVLHRLASIAGDVGQNIIIRDLT